MDPEARLGGGRYVVKGLLGEGAQGVTYEATEAEGGRRTRKHGPGRDRKR